MVFLDTCVQIDVGLLALGQVFALRKVRPTASRSAETHLYYFVIGQQQRNFFGGFLCRVFTFSERDSIRYETTRTVHSQRCGRYNRNADRVRQRRRSRDLCLTVVTTDCTSYRDRLWTTAKTYIKPEESGPTAVRLRLAHFGRRTDDSPLWPKKGKPESHFTALGGVFRQLGCVRCSRTAENAIARTRKK